MEKEGFDLLEEITYVKDSWKIKGGKIHATVRKTLIQNFERLLQEDSTIFINKFGVAENNIKYPIVKHEFKRNFYRNTIVKKCSDYEGPAYEFSFVGFDDIINNKMLLVMLYHVAIWMSLIEMEKRAKGLVWKLKTYGNHTVQNSLFGSRLFINDDIEEINEFKKSLLLLRHADVSSQMGTHLTSQTIFSDRDEFPKKYERKHVDEIADIGKEKVCVVLGTIKSISEEYGWYYLGCRKCTKKVVLFRDYVDLDDIDTSVADHDKDDETLYCPKCKIKAPSIVPRFKVHVRVQDDTGTISFVLFDKEVSKIIGKYASDVCHKQERFGDSDSLPEEVNRLMNKKCIFKIEVSEWNIEKNWNVYTVLKLCDDDEIMTLMVKSSIQVDHVI